MSLINLKEVPLNIQVLLQSPLKATGPLPTPSMSFILKHALQICLVSSSKLVINLCGHVLIKCFDQAWISPFFVYTAGLLVTQVVPGHQSLCFFTEMEQIPATEGFLHLSMQAMVSLSSPFTKNIACMSAFVFCLLTDLQLKRSWIGQEYLWHRRKLRRRKNSLPVKICRIFIPLNLKGN